jgi:hypothetical protein
MNRRGVPQEKEGVVDRVVGWPTAVLELDVLEVLDIPAEGPKDRHDERGLRVLLADVLALVTGDPVPDRSESDVEIDQWRRWLRHAVLPSQSRGTIVVQAGITRIRN